MARRKSDAEVGPLGVWAYDTRVLLGLSDQQVATRADVGKVYIRKIEGGSEPNPSRRVIREMARYFREEGERQRIPVDDPPAGFMADPGDGATTPGLADLITAQTEAIDRQTAMLERVLTVLTAASDPQVVAAIQRALVATEGWPPEGVPNTSEHPLAGVGSGRVP